jgi:hypothetical protein
MWGCSTAGSGLLTFRLKMERGRPTGAWRFDGRDLHAFALWSRCPPWLEEGKNLAAENTKHTEKDIPRLFQTQPEHQ